MPDKNVFFKRQTCQVTQTAVFVKLDSPHKIAAFSNSLSGTGVPPALCSALRGQPGGPRNALVLGHFPFRTAIHPSLKGI